MTVPFSAYIYGAFPIQLEYSGTSYSRKHGRSPIDFPNYKHVAPAEKTDTAVAVSNVVDSSKTAFARDKEVWSKNKPTTLEYMMHAMEACGPVPFR